MKVSRSEMAPLPRAMLHGHGEGGSSLAWSTRKRSATVDRQLIGAGGMAGFASVDAIVRQPIEVATACVTSVAMHPFCLGPPETWLPCLIRVGDRRGRRLSYPCHRPTGQTSLVSSMAMTLIIHATTHWENPLRRQSRIAGARLSARVNARNFIAHPVRPHAPRLFIMGADLQ
jgi:hypothetical protein